MGGCKAAEAQAAVVKRLSQGSSSLPQEPRACPEADALLIGDRQPTGIIPSATAAPSATTLRVRWTPGAAGIGAASCEARRTAYYCCCCQEDTLPAANDMPVAGCEEHGIILGADGPRLP